VSDRILQTQAGTGTGSARAFAICLLLATSGLTHAATLNILPDGTGPYPTIRQALLAAQPGDTISLADGVFTGPDNRNLTLGGQLTLRAASGDPAACILDIQGQGRALTILAAPGTEVLVAGVTLRGGDCRDLPAPQAPGYGGAIYVEGLAPGGSILFERCILEQNRADAGGAVFVYQAGASFQDCAIRDNLATDGAGRSAGTVTSCTLADNRAWIGGGILVSTDAEVEVHRTIIAFNPEGQGLAVNNGIARVTYCDIFGNAGGDWVGAIADQLGVDCNLNADPLFCSLGDGDFTLRDDSPCLPGNSAGCGLIGALPLGCWATSAAEDGPVTAAPATYLAPNYPNPFNPTTTIAYYLAEPGLVRLRIYDTTGRCVRMLAAGEESAGRHHLSWRGVDDRGRPLATGVYLLRFEAAGIRQCRRLVLVR